jgi:hypothetical protein
VTVTQGTTTSSEEQVTSASVGAGSTTSTSPVPFTGGAGRLGLAEGGMLALVVVAVGLL